MEIVEPEKDIASSDGQSGGSFVTPSSAMQGDQHRLRGCVMGRVRRHSEILGLP